MKTNFKETWPKTTLSDAKVLESIKLSIALGDLHPSNLEGHEGAGSLGNRLTSLTYGILSRIARCLPRSWGYGIFGTLGAALGLVFNRRVAKNLAIAFPDMAQGDKRQIARHFWRRFGHSLFEVLDTDRFMRSLDENLTIDGWQHVEAAQSQGRGLALIHAHQASWELIFPTIENIVGPICGVYAPGSVPALHRRVLHRRTLFGADVYPRDFQQATVRVVKGIKAGKNLVIAMDQRVRADHADFFGRPARTSRGAIRMATMAKAPLIPMDLRRTGRGTFTLTFHPDIRDVGETEDVLRAYHDLLEGWITERPADWFWLHNRWK